MIGTEKRLAYELKDREFTVAAFYLPDPSQEAYIEIRRNGELYRTFNYPAYRIWNIYAHFSDIVNEILEEERP